MMVHVSQTRSGPAYRAKGRQKSKGRNRGMMNVSRFSVPRRARCIGLLFAFLLALTVCLLIVKPVWASILSFAPAQSYSVGQDPFSVTGADFNGDSRADLAVATTNSNSSGFDDVSVLLNKGDGTFATAQGYKVGQFPNSVISADFNEDGKKDLAVANGCGSDVSVSGSCNGNVSVLSGNGDGTFGSAQFVAVGTGNVLQSVASSDFDGDGNLDLAVAIRYKSDANGNWIPSNQIAVLLGNGDGTFGTPTFFGAGTGPYSVTPADLNGDGKADLAVANADSNNVSVLLGRGDGTFGTAQNFNVGNAATYVSIEDFNKDGKKDLAVAAYLSGVQVLLGNGDGTFGAAQNVGFYRAFSITSADFDSDGNLDLAASDVGSDRVSVSRGNGDGTFGSPQTFQVVPDVRSVISTDFNGDQKADLTVANHSSSSVSVLLNTTTPDTTQCTQTGTSSGETILGTPEADVICAGGGNDTVKGLGGNDILKGQGGNDKLLGGVGNDSLDGDIGTDTASYSASLTAVSPSLATNSSTGEGSDTFVGLENLLGSPKADTLTGSAANNTLTGGGGNDAESGGEGNDKVVGSGGADTLNGQGGADTVNSKDGVSGNDSLDGGLGTDTKITDATEKLIVGFP